jgi:hypothetical protein
MSNSLKRFLYRILFCLLVLLAGAIMPSKADAEEGAYLEIPEQSLHDGSFDALDYSVSFQFTTSTSVPDKRFFSEAKDYEEEEEQIEKNTRSKNSGKGSFLFSLSSALSGLYAGLPRNQVAYGFIGGSLSARRIHLLNQEFLI